MFCWINPCPVDRAETILGIPAPKDAQTAKPAGGSCHRIPAPPPAHRPRIANLPFLCSGRAGRRETTGRSTGPGQARRVSSLFASTERSRDENHATPILHLPIPRILSRRPRLIHQPKHVCRREAGVSAGDVFHRNNRAAALAAAPTLYFCRSLRWKPWMAVLYFLGIFAGRERTSTGKSRDSPFGQTASRRWARTPPRSIKKPRSQKFSGTCPARSQRPQHVPTRGRSAPPRRARVATGPLAFGCAHAAATRTRAGASGLGISRCGVPLSARGGRSLRTSNGRPPRFPWSREKEPSWRISTAAVPGDKGRRPL